jgi:hypothetical protein
VEVVESDADRIVADRLEPDEPDMGAAVYQRLPPMAMPLDFGRRTLDAQIFGWKTKPAAIVEGDLKEFLRAFEPQLDRPM